MSSLLSCGDIVCFVGVCFCLSVVFEREQGRCLEFGYFRLGGWWDWDGIGCLMMNSFSLFILH